MTNNTKMNFAKSIDPTELNKTIGREAVAKKKKDEVETQKHEDGKEAVATKTENGEEATKNATQMITNV